MFFGSIDFRLKTIEVKGKTIKVQVYVSYLYAFMLALSLTSCHTDGTQQGRSGFARSHTVRTPRFARGNITGGVTGIGML